MSSSNYLSEVTNLFICRRGGIAQLSPLDWTIIDQWERDGIPLRIVLRAINEVFDNLEEKYPIRKASIKSISYCQEEIEACFEEWLEMQVGKN